MSGVDAAPLIDSRRYFVLALRRILRPIIRLLIRNGVGYAEFADVARGAYVESAIRNAVNDGTTPTREQVARVTGIPRERVDHYIDDADALPTVGGAQTAIFTEVLHRWHTDPRYLGPEGIPLELELQASSGPSFQSLVTEVNADAHADLVLDELLKTKSLVYSDEKSLRVVRRSFIWPDELPHGIEHFGNAMAHLIQTLEYNFNSGDFQNNRLERFVSADQGLPAGLLQSFHEFAKERADQFLFDLDDWLARFSDTRGEPELPRAEAGVNVFLSVEPPPDSRALSALVQARRDAGT